MMIYYFSTSASINAVLAFVLGLFVFTRDKKKLLYVTFFIFCMFGALWNFSYFIWLTVKTKELALFWIRMVMVGTLFIQVSFLHYVLVFLNQNKGWKKKVMIAGYLIDLLLFPLCFTPLIISGVEQKLFFPFWPEPGKMLGLYLINFFVFMFFAHYLLYRQYRSEKPGLKKFQLKISFWAVIVGYVGGVSNWPLFFDIPIAPWTHIFVSFYIGLMAYAIIRHRLMDIEVIIRRAVVFAGLFAGVYGVLAFFTFLTQDVFQAITGGNRWFALVPSIFIITIALRPLETFLINTTDKYLFQKKYDYKELLRTFADDVLSVMDLKKILDETINTLVNTLRIENSGIIILNRDRNIYELTASKGIKNKGLTFDRESLLISYLERSKMHLEKNKHLQHINDKGTIKEDMKKLEAELVLPLVLHDSLIGAITLGSKKSGEPYTQDDLDILIPLSRSEAVAISNAQVMDDLSKTQAEAAQREKMAVIGTLAAGINHEICNPLGIARGQCEVFLLNAKDGLYEKRAKEEQVYEAMKIMEKVIKETDRATAITKKLSSFAKPGSGDINEDVDVAHEVDEVYALVGHELKLDKIDFAKEIPKNLPHIIADRKQIQEIFFNLIRNAGQAIKERGKITVRAREEDKKVVVDIEDTGQGIPEDKLGQIFNPFYTTKAPGKGTGLGLFIVRQVVQRNRGNISVKSKVGQGTTFTLEFPVLSM